MPIPEDVVRCRLVFDLGEPGSIQESAILGFHMRRFHKTGNTTNWDADTQQIAEKVRDKWITNMQTSRFPASTRLNRAEAYHLDTGGKTLDKGVAPTRNVSGGLWYGTATSASLPFEVATAVSLYGFPVGSFVRDAASKRGRFYLPPLAVTAMGTGTDQGRIAGATLTALAADLGLLLNDYHRMEVGPSVQVESNDYMELGVLSQTKGLFTRIQAYRIGNVPDAQRRRRRDQLEGFAAGTVTDS